jgi:hypothetical protein
MANNAHFKEVCEDCKHLIFSKSKTQSQRREIFNYIFNGQANFMTPHIDYFYGNDKVLMELSHGEDFSYNIFYGVTVIKKCDDGDWIKAYQGQAFTGAEAKKKALDYIKQLKEEYK